MPCPLANLRLPPPSSSPLSLLTRPFSLLLTQTFSLSCPRTNHSLSLPYMQLVKRTVEELRAWWGNPVLRAMAMGDAAGGSPGGGGQGASEHWRRGEGEVSAEGGGRRLWSSQGGGERGEGGSSIGGGGRWAGGAPDSAAASGSSRSSSGGSGVRGRDMGSVSSDIQRADAALASELPWRIPQLLGQMAAQDVSTGGPHELPCLVSSPPPPP
jgi:hypothetical protein